MIDFIMHPSDLVTVLRDDPEVTGRNFARFVEHIRKSFGVFPELKDPKTVKVCTLKRGDTFVLKDFGEQFPNVYIVTSVSDRCVEVTSFSGKVFTFGRKFEVIPVHLSCAVSIAEV